MSTSVNMRRRFDFDGWVYTIYTVARTKRPRTPNCVYRIYTVYTLHTAEQSFERSCQAL
nr:MAG TPA: hypothetical protein [Caudoviricetes sp.]